MGESHDRPPRPEQWTPDPREGRVDAGSPNGRGTGRPGGHARYGVLENLATPAARGAAERPSGAGHEKKEADVPGPRGDSCRFFLCRVSVQEARRLLRFGGVGDPLRVGADLGSAQKSPRGSKIATGPSAKSKVRHRYDASGTTPSHPRGRSLWAYGTEHSGCATDGRSCPDATRTPSWPLSSGAGGGTRPCRRGRLCKPDNLDGRWENHRGGGPSQAYDRPGRVVPPSGRTGIAWCTIPTTISEVGSEVRLGRAYGATVIRSSSTTSPTTAASVF